ncbi:MAG TPA: hypothetical protein VGX70_07390 [Gemmataceae bacterium]|nr:hypothetical protein [Gemmataceae bacterium]
MRSLLPYLAGPSKAESGHATELQSAAVQRLMQRVRSVITRRDLALPPASSGSAVDPNSIAEYLDGVLSPDRLAEIEELCLASDKYLAEVGACWEILHKGQHTVPSPAFFQRMHGLVKKPAGAQAQGIARQRARKAVTTAAAVFVCVLFLLLGWEMGVFDRQKAEDFIAGLTEDPARQESHEIENHAKEDTPANRPRDAKSDPNVLARFVADDGEILLRNLPDNSWQVAPPELPLSPGDLVVSLPGFRAPIRLTSGLEIHLLGNLPAVNNPAEPSSPGREIWESAIRLHADPQLDLDVTLLRGRIVITNQKANGEGHARLRFGDEKWDLTLPEPGNAAALELRTYIPAGALIDKDHHGEEPTSELSLFALRGRAELKVRYDSYSLEPPPGPAMFSWNNVGPISRRPQDLKQLPTWAAEVLDTPGGKPKADPVPEALTGLQQKLLGAASVPSALKDSLNHPDISTRVLAIYCLGAIEELDAVLDAFGNERQFREVRLASMTAIRNWISRGADNQQRLFLALEKKYSSATGEVILHLWNGFSEAQLQTPEVYASLIGYLKHPDLPVRELAHHQLILVVPEGKAITYDPAGARGQRDLAVEEWKKLIPSGSIPAKNKKD